MKFTNAQWAEILCTFMEVDGQPDKIIAGIREIVSSAKGSADLKDMIHHSLFAAKF
jgi:hypothetical protein